MYNFDLRYLQTHLRILQDLQQEGTSRLSLSLTDDLQTRSQELGCTFSYNDTWVTEWSKDLVEYEADVGVKVRWAVARELLQDENTSVPSKLRFVRQQCDSLLYFKVHEIVATERGPAYIRNLSESFGCCEHDIDVGVWKESLDIVV